jgi:probable blue pigment (indigoidine) exporter
MKAPFHVPEQVGRAPSSIVRALLMSVVTAGAAICFPAIKAGLAFSPPLKFAALRTLIAGLAILVAAALTRQSLWLPRRLVMWVLPLGLTATTFTFGSMFLSPEFTSTAVASVLGNMQPLAVIVFAVIFLSERITRRKACAVLLGLAGVVLIAVRANASASGESNATLLGAALALLSSLSAAGASIMFKKLSPAGKLITLTGWQMVAGSLPLFALSTLFEKDLTVRWNFSFVGILLLLAIVGSALTTVVWVWLLQKYDAGTLSLYLFLTPVFAIVTAFVTFRERLDWIQLSGGAAILAGIAFDLLHPAHIPVSNSIEPSVSAVGTEEPRNE